MFRHDFLAIFLLFFTTSLQLWAQDYRAPLQPVNPSITAPGLTGTVRLVQQGDKLQVTIDTKGLAPEMIHLQHLHFSRDGMLCGQLDIQPTQH